MALTYQAKRELIDHLADKSAWRNLHDEPDIHDKFNQVVYGHEISFEQQSKEFDLTTAVKMVVAFDFDIEPSLSVTTRKGFADALQSLRNLDKDMVEQDQIQSWNDITEFEGDNTSLSTVFRIRRYGHTTDLQMTLDGREAIWAQTEVLNKALGASDIPPTQFISFDNMPRTILHLLKDGQVASDHRNNEWVYRVIHSTHSAQFANEARKHAHSSFRVKGDEFSAMCVDKGVTVIAMVKDVLQHQLRHYRPLFPGMV